MKHNKKSVFILFNSWKSVLKSTITALLYQQAFIREVKTKKQIFLVTHNPSIVVYGDAECVIIAENTNEKISYKQVKLEDHKAQKEICDILDGGEYIFNKRAEKYNIKKLKTN